MFQSLKKFLHSYIALSKPAKVKKKPAIALITYCRGDYFEKVLNSILAQQINNRPFSDFFDLYIFQDGLVENAPQADTQGHRVIAQLCLQKLDSNHVITQTKNLGVALHFDLVERFLFEEQDLPWAAFCEDDLVLAPGYLATLSNMAQCFKDDERVAMFSCFGKTSKETIASQTAKQDALISMDHHWGFGMHQSAWRRRQPLVDEYLKLLQGTSYRARQHARIQNWQSFCGFKPGPTSQDYAKACAMSALGALKVSSYANFGTYIGEYGLHFTPELYAQKGYANSTIYPAALTQPFQLDQGTYHQLLKEQKAFTMDTPDIFDQADFLRRLKAGSLAPSFSDQWQTGAISEADVVAAYKLFLGRLPETRKVIEARIGMHPERFLASFITAPEFRARKQFAPIILSLAKEIINENKKSATP